MGQKTVGTSNLPDVQNVVVSKQYIGGSLFKSQNGTIWTASQYQDLKFTLRKAEFVDSGSTTFYNTPVEAGNLNTQVLPTNPIHTLPRKLKVSIDGTGTRNVSNLPIGRKISSGAAADPENTSITGIIEGQGSNITGTDIVNSGIGYKFGASQNNIPLISLSGGGVNATGNFTVNADETINSVSVQAGSSGFKVGDVLTIDNSNVNVLRGTGFKLVVTTINTDFDTLYLTDVQGDAFNNNESLVTYGANNDTRAVIPDVAVNGQSVLSDGDLYTGKVIEVTQYNHAHHGATNQVDIKNVKPDTTLVPTISAITAEDTVVSLGNTDVFSNFAGIATDRGEALIGEEIVSYVVGTGQLLLTRGILNTTATSHETGSTIQTYEIAGMPLVGINTTHTVPTNTTLRDASNIDNYYLEVDTVGIAPNRVGKSLLCFSNEKAIGGRNVKISQNHQFSAITPQFNVLTPGSSTRVNTTIRTVSGTSADGNEISFIDQGFEPAILNQTIFYPTPRLVASKVNENARLEDLPKKKSLTVSVDMTTEDPNLSPALDTKNATFILGRNKINNPVANYTTDNRTNQIKDDPHGSVFVSSLVNLEQPATSLKVLVGASRLPDADFRVFYRLFSEDSSEVSQTYRAFPGYTNLKDINGDGFGDEIIDLGLNDGRADAFVAPNRLNEFSEYQFSVDNLEEFTGFVIKIVMSSTNESQPVKFRDFRAIALA